mmetsp:Transcript_7143/g.10262  ORF Transcript_7143/g.10262 Transcript_7143/m.10262 type:complete len:238 (+) Transcript_7143:139-852(+)
MAHLIVYTGILGYEPLDRMSDPKRICGSQQQEQHRHQGRHRRRSYRRSLSLSLSRSRSRSRRSRLRLLLRLRLGLRRRRLRLRLRAWPSVRKRRSLSRFEYFARPESKEESWASAAFLPASVSSFALPAVNSWFPICSVSLLLAPPTPATLASCTSWSAVSRLLISSSRLLFVTSSSSSPPLVISKRSSTQKSTAFCTRSCEAPRACMRPCVRISSCACGKPDILFPKASSAAATIN